MSEIIYPPKPLNVSEKVTEPSAAFKKEVSKVLLSIGLFIMVYFLLMGGAIGLALLTGFGGLMLIAAYPSVITIMLGLGLIGLGIMVLIFLIKFLFKKVSADRSNLTEIKKKDQPELFEFIQKLTDEVGAPFPKRIYLSADVNASVFYDSGFWSMFLPVRKNLHIGLGLVNAVNLSELKAVLAHEFGHFSQRSMKLGSYVYNVNQVIYNMLYDNVGYGKALESWGNISGYFAIFANLTIGIVEGIQSILKKMYSYINKNYMGLSQQMEFHADAVAASVAGGNQLITALRRLNVAANCHQKLMETYGAWMDENLKAENMYPHHTALMQRFSADFAIPLDHGLPHIDESVFKKLFSSRVVIKDQWASHPSTEDRAHELEQLNLTTETVYLPAWSIIRDTDRVQKQMTDQLYAAATFKQTPKLFNDIIFHERFEKEVQKFRFDPIYKGYYDYRPVLPADFSKAIEVPAQSINELLTDETLGNPKKLDALINDIQTLNMLRSHPNDIETFELDGKRYSKKEIAHAIEKLDAEQKQLEASIAEADNRVAFFFFRKAQAVGKETDMEEKYNAWATAEAEAKKMEEQYTGCLQTLQPAYQSQLTIESAYSIDNQLKMKAKHIKEWMQKILEATSNTDELKKEERERLTAFVNDKSYYFTESTGFNNPALELLTQSTAIFFQYFVAKSLQAKRNALEWQLQLLTN
ncbi:MAG: M48 family metalloprotease [Bacteroidetes bacterium]|nr:M48 family metalloprotease [Bacteroidota bacterium]